MQRPVEELLCPKCSPLFAQVVAHLRGQIADRQQVANQITEHYNLAVAHLERVTLEHSQAQRQLNEQLGQAKKQLAQCQSNLRGARAQALAREQRIEQLKRLVVVQKEEKQSMQGVFSAANQDSGKAIRELKREYAEERRLKDKEHRDVQRNLQVEIESLRARMDILAREKDKTKDEILELQSRRQSPGVESLMKELELSQAEAKKRQRQNDQLRHKLEDSRSQLAELHSQLKVVKAEHQIVSDQAAQERMLLQGSLQKAQTELKYFKHEAEDWSIANQELKAQKEQYIREVAALKGRYQRLLPLFEDKIRQLHLKVWELQDEMQLGRSQMLLDLPEIAHPEFVIHKVEIKKENVRKQSPREKSAPAEADSSKAERGRDEWAQVLGQIHLIGAAGRLR